MNEETVVVEEKARLEAEIEAAVADVEVKSENAEVEPGGDDIETSELDRPDEGAEALGGQSPDADEEEEGEGGGADEASEEDDGSGEDEVLADDGASGAEGAVSDELLERAVRAGLSISDARSVASSLALEKICGQLEASSSESAGSGGGGAAAAVADTTSEDLLTSIPDLDPEEYTEEMVDGWKAMKEHIRRQDERINDLQATTSGNEVQAWFDIKVSELSEDLGSALKEAPEKRAALRNRFDALAVGYDAGEMEIEPDTIFNEAVTLTLGDVAAKAAETKRAQKLQKREAQTISRPGGVKRINDQTGNAVEDVAAEIQVEFEKRRE